MAAVAENVVASPMPAAAAAGAVEERKAAELRRDVKELVDLLSKLNPSAKEFFPASYHAGGRRMPQGDVEGVHANGMGNGNYHTRRRKCNNNQWRRRLNGGSFRAQREESIRRTVYVSEVDHQVTEERLAALFLNCGHVVDCRICGDPHSILRFAFVEFADDEGARAALSLSGTMLGFYPVKVLPSKTAILPVNPTFLPRSEDEREMCSRTVYCTNIDKKVSQTDVEAFFETTCGEVSRLRLLGDHMHNTRIAFVEFVQAESAIIALSCSGNYLGTLPIRYDLSAEPENRIFHYLNLFDDTLNILESIGSVLRRHR